jgi:hypothetical protein
MDGDLTISRFDNAQAVADGLFRESFNAPFPVPRDNCGLPIPTPPENWSQYVALYSWPDGNTEAVGFCNWIRHSSVYLQGGMCVKKNFYRRLPKDRFREYQAAGGIAQMMMAVAATELDDCDAWFGYCGDPKALAVDLRAGYVQTGRPHIIVKWFRDLPKADQTALVDAIARIGPF